MSDFAVHAARVKVGLLAGAVAAAAILTPAIAAEAKPVATPSLPASPLANFFGTDPIEGPVTLSTDSPWWWIGSSPNPDPALISFAPLAASGNTIIDFQPLALIPGFLQPIAGAVLGMVPSFDVCIAGLGVSLSPYRRITVKSSAC